MTTLASATLALAKVLTYWRGGTSTGGSTTTLVDTARTEPADYWNDGTIWFTSGNNSGKSTAILDWALTTWTFTFATQSGACAATNTYFVAPPDFPRDVLIESINAAQRAIGNIPQEDVTLTTVEDQEDYTLPAGVYNVKEIYIATSTTSPYSYVLASGGDWEEQATSGEIRFRTGREPGNTGYLMRLIYEAPLSDVTTDTGTITAYINLERLTWEAAVCALEWKLKAHQEVESRFWEDQLKLAMIKREEARRKWPIPKVNRMPRYSL